MVIDYPWPENEARVDARVYALVASVVGDSELKTVRLEWVTPVAHQWDDPDARWVALRVTVVAVADEVFAREVWGPNWYCAWEDELGQLASDLEDWVCETSFAWGEQRTATIPP